ncbi:MAG: methyltransferase domain-containing protein [Acidimicrobiia bacterium]
MTWDPSCYGAHGDLRLRPGREIMARVSIEPSLVYDLGCGTGELTNELARRWPGAAVIGIDSSNEMLGQVRPEGNVTLRHEDIEDWEPDEAPDLIFSNATLHWLPNHEHLFGRLLGELRPGGVLAVQMPDNWREPTHQLIYEEVDRRGWTDRLDGHLLRNPVAPFSQYLDWLAAASEIDAWRTTYYQAMDGPDRVLSWVRGSVLVPVQSILSAAEFSDFSDALADAYRRAYPPSPSGRTVLPISRVFLVARS